MHFKKAANPMEVKGKPVTGGMLLRGALAAGAVLVGACDGGTPGTKDEQAIIRDHDFEVKLGHTLVLASDVIERKTPVISNRNDIRRVAEDQCMVIQDPVFAEVHGQTYVAYMSKQPEGDDSVEDAMRWIAYDAIKRESQPQDEHAPYIVDLADNAARVVDGDNVTVSNHGLSVNGQPVAQAREMNCDDAAFMLGIDNPNVG